MIELIEINTSHSLYPYVEHLLVESFPPEERRDLPLQRANVDDNPLMRCLCIVSDGKPAGLLTYWDFGDFCYVEHFATDPQLRNRGLGAKAFQAFAALAGRPVALEAEMPDTELARRRVGFYQRQGLRLWDECGYLQPPYRAADAPLPMRLMASKGLEPERDFDRLRRKIHSEVYGLQ